MKQFNEYIMDKIFEEYSSVLKDIEIINTDNDYRTIILVKRTNINCKELTEEEFVNMMNEDYKLAVSRSKKLLELEHEESKEERIKKAKERAEEYATRRWKRKSNIEEYVKNAIKNEENRPRETFYEIKEFSLDTDWGKKNGDSINIVSDENVRIEHLKGIYKDLTTNDYSKSFWDDAKGWEFKYQCHKNEYRRTFTPWVDLILSDSKKEEIEKNKKKLGEEIEAFYKNSKYWGD